MGTKKKGSCLTIRAPWSARTLFLFFFLCILICFGGVFRLSGQYFEYGQDPASLQWKQIKTPYFRLLFPEDFTENALRIAGILEGSRASVSYSLNHSPKRIPVVLHNYTAQSNGFLAWAPKRIELFTTPPQNLYPHYWTEQLALHEYRHTVQVDKLNQGTTRFLSYLGGEQITGAFSSLLGEWLLEGDAVYSETLLSHSGRGRLPSFEMGLRARALDEKRFFRYDEVLLESYKTYTPDYYEFGYQMIAYGRLKQGNALWENALNTTGKYPFLVNPVYFSLKKKGYSKRKLFDATFQELSSRWKEQYRENSYTPFYPYPVPESKAYTSYRYPQVVCDSLLLTLKSGMDQTDEFVLLFPDGKEKKIRVPGVLLSDGLSAKGSFLTWSEMVPDPLWENRQYSVIKLLDLKSGKENQLTRQTRFYAPSLNHQTDRIVVVEVSPQDEYTLVVLDRTNGSILHRYPTPDKLFPIRPVWYENDRDILFIGLDSRGKGLYRLNSLTGEWSTLLPPSFYEISAAVPSGPYVYYSSSLSGIDNIYALDSLGKESFRVVSSPFGAFDPCVDTNTYRLYYSHYTSHGYQIAYFPLDTKSWEKTSNIRDGFRGFAGELTPLEPLLPDSLPLSPENYAIKPYRKALHLFNFHSWLPFYFDLDNFSLSEPSMAPGLTLFSQNTLSTAFTTLGWEYREGIHSLHAGFTYKGIMPVVEINYDLGGTTSLIKPSSLTSSFQPSATRQTLSLDLSLPLDLTHNRFYRSLTPSFSLNYTNDIFYNLETEQYEQDILYSQARVYFYSLHTTSTRDLYPRWGSIADFSYIFVPNHPESFHPSLKTKLVFFLPGLFSHHGIRLEGIVQQQNLEKYVYMASQELPRGYATRSSEHLQALQSDYVFPLFYPDLNLPGIFFLKRVQGGLFCDLALNQYRRLSSSGDSYVQVNERLFSWGGSLSFDFHLFRIAYPVQAGARYAYLPYEKTGVIEGIFSLDIYGFSISHR